MNNTESINSNYDLNSEIKLHQLGGYIISSNERPGSQGTIGDYNYLLLTFGEPLEFKF